MSNLSNAENAVSDVETEIARFDEATELVKAKQTEIAELERTHQENTIDHGADFKSRLKTHSANLSALVLHRADLLTLQASADTQKGKVLEAGTAAVTALQSVRFDLLAQAKISATESLTKLYAPRSIAPILHTHLPLSTPVQAVPPVPYLPKNSDLAVTWLRKLRSRTLASHLILVKSWSLDDVAEPAVATL